MMKSWKRLFCCWSSLKKLTASLWWLQNSPYTCFIRSAFSSENCAGAKPPYASLTPVSTSFFFLYILYFHS